jgi:hypothetical protein
MRPLFLAAASMSMVGCGSATAAGPGSNTPAHCLAAFNYAAYWFKVGNEPDNVAQELAHGLYVMEKVKSDGGLASDVLAEAKQFSLAHAKNSKEMGALYLACGKAQANDPRFRAEFSRLLAKARPLVPQFEATATP